MTAKKTTIKIDTSARLSIRGVTQEVRQLDRDLMRYIVDGTIDVPDVIAEARNHAAALAAEVARVNEAGYTGKTDTARAIATGVLDGWDTVDPFLIVAVFDARLEVLRLAAEQAANIYGSACMSYADDLLEQVDAKVVTPIADLYAAAADATTDDDTVETLTRAGRTDDAIALARALDPAHIDALKAADRLRFMLQGYNRVDPALPWFPGVTAADLTPARVLSAFRSGQRFVDFIDPKSYIDAGLVDEDEDDDAPRTLHPVTFYPRGLRALDPQPKA